MGLSLSLLSPNPSSQKQRRLWEPLHLAPGGGQVRSLALGVIARSISARLCPRKGKYLNPLQLYLGIILALLKQERKFVCACLERARAITRLRANIVRPIELCRAQCLRAKSISYRKLRLRKFLSRASPWAQHQQGGLTMNADGMAKIKIEFPAFDDRQ